MKFAVVSLLASGLAMAMAAPPEPQTFELMALRSASPVHFAPFSAARSSLFLYLPHQGAKCQGQDPNRATFYIKDGGLFLYSGRGKKQQIFVDRSGMGQGKVGYITGDSVPGSRWELQGWEIDQHDDLYFKGTSLIACPGSIDNSWSVWVATRNLTPGGNKNCLGLISRTIPTKDSVRCEYS